jgi:5-methylcytosine-specific restriction endonuclease McrA
MRFRSKKREKQYGQRRTLVVQLLEEFPVCQRCSSAAAVDVHELIRRSQWADGFLVKKNLKTLCRPCHTWITEHPEQAVKEGFADWSHNRYLYDNQGQAD